MAVHPLPLGLQAKQPVSVNFINPGSCIRCCFWGKKTLTLKTGLKITVLRNMFSVVRRVSS